MLLQTIPIFSEFRSVWFGVFKTSVTSLSPKYLLIILLLGQPVLPPSVLLKILSLFKNILVHLVPVHGRITMFCQEDYQIHL